MNEFENYFDYVSAEHYIPVYAVTATNNVTIVITERDIQDFTNDQSQIKNINHFSFFMIKKIERENNLIKIEIDLKKSKHSYFSESNIESEIFLYQFETNDANNFILYLNRALYRILTPEEIKSINVDECSKFVTLFPPSSSALNNNALKNDNHPNNSQMADPIQPFYVYSRFIEKVLLSNSNSTAQPIEKLVSEVSLKNLRKTLKYKISKLNIFRDFPDCSKYFEILLIDIIPYSKYITNLVFDSSINSTNSNNIENYVKCIIKCIEKSNHLKEITFVGELPSDIENLFSNFCEKKEMSILSLTFKNVKLSQQQLSILSSSPISSYRFSGQTFDSIDTLLNFIETTDIELLSVKNSPQTDFLSNLNKFTNITVLSLCKNNIEIGDFFSCLSKIESRIQCLYLSGNKCEKQISSDVKMPEFEEIRLDNISWGDFFLSYFQILLKTQSFVDLSNSTMSENEWNKVFNYLNTTSDGVSQLSKLLWNGNQVNKSFFSYLRKCIDSLDSLQIFDVIDQSTEKEIFDEFTSFLKEAKKLANLFIGFSKQGSRSMSGNQFKSILSALLINMKNENSKQFYLSVPNSSSGDEGVDALIDSFNNIEDCKINFITFDGLRPKDPQKYTELCDSITNHVMKLKKNKNSSYEIQFPRNDLKFLKNQMQESDYKKLRQDFRFIIISHKFDYLHSDFVYNRMVLSPILTKKRYYVKKENDELFFDMSSNSNLFYNSLSDSSIENERKRKKKGEKILPEDEDNELFDSFLEYSETNLNKKSDANNDDDDAILSEDGIDDENANADKKNEANKDGVDEEENVGSSNQKNDGSSNDKESKIENSNRNDKSDVKSNDENGINNKTETQEEESSIHANDKANENNIKDRNINQNDASNEKDDEENLNKEKILNDKNGNTINKKDDKNESQNPLFEIEEEEQDEERINQQRSSQNNCSQNDANDQKGDKQNEIEYENGNKPHKSNQSKSKNNIGDKNNEDDNENESIHPKTTKTQQNENSKVAEKSKNKNDDDNQSSGKLDGIKSENRSKIQKSSQIQNKNNDSDKNDKMDQSSPNKNLRTKRNRETEKNINDRNDSTINKKDYKSNEPMHSNPESKKHEHSKTTKKSMNPQFENEDEEEEEDQINQQRSNRNKRSKKEANAIESDNQNGNKEGSKTHKSSQIQTRNSISNKSNKSSKSSKHSPIKKTANNKDGKSTAISASQKLQFEYDEEEEEEEQGDQLATGQKRHSPNMVKLSLYYSNARKRKSKQKGEPQRPHLEIEYEEENENQKLNTGQTKKNSRNEDEDDVFEKAAQRSSVKSFTPNRNRSNSHKVNRSSSPKQNRKSPIHRTKRVVRHERAYSFISAPLSPTPSHAPEHKSRNRQMKKRGEENYESDSGYDEPESVTFQNKSTNTDQDLTPNRTQRKILHQTQIIEKVRKVDLLNGVEHTHKHKHQSQRDDVLMNVQSLNASRRASMPYKKEDPLFDVVEDNGSDIEFPEMDEITLVNLDNKWEAIQEKFSYKNILNDIRTNK